MLDMVIPIPEQMTDMLLQLPGTLTQTGQEALVSYSLPWPDGSLIDFLEGAADAPRVYWASQETPLAFAGYDVAAVLTAHGRDRFQSIQRQAAQLFENVVILNKAAPPVARPRLFGGFSFQVEASAHPLWSTFAAARFMLPRYQLSQFEGQSWLTINHRFHPSDDPVELAWLIHTEVQMLRTGVDLSKTSESAEAGPQQMLRIDDLIEPAAWNRLISGVTQRIRRGELEKVVLARARRIQTAQPVRVTGVLSHLEASYPGCYRFLVEPVPGHAFYGATPELLADVTDSRLRTTALAGSIRRGSSPAEDEALGQQLLANPKEQLEHSLVVEAIRENLEPLAARLDIAPQPELYRLSNIQHLQTVIEADLPAGCSILPIIETLHPTPALGGRPRAIALPLIHEAEAVSRGWYGGPVGWLDQHGNGLFAVAIRSAVSVGQESMLYAGVGIVAGSIPEKEWQETQLKFKPLMEALAGANPR